MSAVSGDGFFDDGFCGAGVFPFLGAETVLPDAVEGALVASWHPTKDSSTNRNSNLITRLYEVPEEPAEEIVKAGI